MAQCQLGEALVGPDGLEEHLQCLRPAAWTLVDSDGSSEVVCDDHKQRIEAGRPGRYLFTAYIDPTAGN